jgi:DNA adenine methylase
MVKTKPILKWVGGKTQILDTLMTKFPSHMVNYHEPFVGGGSVLLALLTQLRENHIHVEKHIFAYDANEPLIGLYKNIQTRHEELYIYLQNMIEEFHPLTEGLRETYYYEKRTQYNELSNSEKIEIMGSALFLFLNKTCFRGMYRVGPHGFNVPYGNNKNPEIINKEHLNKIHELIQPVVFECCDFTVALSKIAEGDFVYLDPPYAPETATSFVKYTQNGFSENHHRDLFALIHSLTQKNIKMLLSNADVDIVRENFASSHYTMDSLLCKRLIHSKKPTSMAKEVIVSNWTPSQLLIHSFSLSK